LAGQVASGMNATLARQERVARPVRRALQTVAVILLIGLAAFGAGFGYFLWEITRLADPSKTSIADGIVVLTGGRARVGTGFELLKSGSGKRLLISGVHPDTSLTSIRKAVKGGKELFECCVDVDKAALDTVGNAEQAASWARNMGFRSLIVVTSDYHMPRSLLEFRRKMPDVTLIAHEVQSTPHFTPASIIDSASLAVLVPEYLKFIASWLRLGLRENASRTALASALPFGNAF
jgi:uncharacterized SAM-binding protein YcdF (DUF218 family)